MLKDPVCTRECCTRTCGVRHTFFREKKKRKEKKYALSSTARIVILQARGLVLKEKKNPYNHNNSIRKRIVASPTLTPCV